MSGNSATAPAPPKKSHSGDGLPLLGYLLLIGITIFWGGNWPALKISLSEISVWWFRSICLLVGGGGLLAIAAVTGQRVRTPRAETGPLILCAVFTVIGWHLCSAYGVSLTAAGRSAILAFTMPLWATIFGAFLLAESITRAKLVGLVLGMAGLAVLIGPDLVAFQAAPLGAIFLVAAAASWGFGTVLLKRFTWSISTTTLVGWQLLVGAVPITIGALLFEPFPDLTALSTPAVAALVYVLAFPMIFCQWAYVRIVRLFPASIAAIGTLAIPVVGVYSAALILDEPVGWQEGLSLLLICGGLAAVLLVPVLRRRQA